MNQPKQIAQPDWKINSSSHKGVFFQPKLSVNHPNDIYEQEADVMADHVMRIGDASTGTGAFFKPAETNIQRKCEHCEEEEKKVHRKESSGTETQAHGSLDSYVNSLGYSGRSLSSGERSFFEPRFGHDFSNVRIHNDTVAAKSAESVNALAYTTGNNIVFNTGQYSPDTDQGKKLLAHELTHVVQQRGPQENAIQRQLAGDPGQSNIDYVDQRDGAPHATTCGAPSTCPATFCQPYTSENLARHERDRMMFILLAGIAAAVNTRVVPLWSEYLMGGSPPKNLTADFGNDFATSPTTQDTTTFFINAIRRNLTASPPSFPAGVNITTVTLSSLIPPEITAINTPGGAHEMNFNYPSDIAGNIAGGIGDNQTACRSGAQPSPFNDERLASGIVTITKDSTNNLTVMPVINYTVRDTIDLCPGNCGTSMEQIATVPMSQFEATGISGDVPFTINFSAVPPPFVIPHT